MAFHAGRPPGSGSVILFGGRLTGGALSNETWAWNGASWIPLPMETSPPARNGQRMVYFPERDYVLMFGGNVMPTDLVLDNDTWTLDGGDWMERTPVDSPSNRCCGGLAHFPGAPGRVVLFGGGIRPMPEAVGDMWTWVGGGSNTWTCISPNCQRNPLP